MEDVELEIERGGAVVRRLLDLSIDHLPAWIRTAEHLKALSEVGFVVHATADGYFLWVPDDPFESFADADHAMREELAVLRIQVYARQRGCDYILFDADGEVNDDLPVFEAEE